MLHELLVIGVVAALIGAIGYLLGRRHPGLGLAWAAALTALLVWQANAIADSPAVLMVLSPEAMRGVYAVAVGYVAALVLTLWPVVRPRRAAG